MVEMEVTDDFDNSLKQCIEESAIRRYDGFVTLFWRITGLTAIILPTVLLFISFFYGAEFQIPMIYSIALAMFIIAIYLSVGIVYHYAKTEDNVRLRLQVVIFGVLCLMFGIPGIFLMSLQLVIPISNPDYLFWSIIFGFVMFALFIWGVFLDKLVIQKIAKTLDVILKDSVKPFNEILGNTFTSHVFGLRSFALGICILYVSLLWIILYPGLWVLLGYYVIATVMIHFIRKQPEFERMYYSANRVIDLATFSLNVSKQLEDFGIGNFKVYHRPSFFSGYVSVFTTEVFPDGFSPLMIIHPSGQFPDYSNIQTELNEKWNPDFIGRMVGPAECPFRPFNGRIFIDSTVWNAEKILWWGPDHRIAIVIQGPELRKNEKVLIGDYAH